MTIARRLPSLTLLCVSLFALFPALAAQADDSSRDPSYEPYDLDLNELFEIKIVSAARHRQNIADAPATIYVITSDEIRQSGLTSVPEILRRVPGLEIMRIASDYCTIRARGTYLALSNKILFMVDGRVLFESRDNFLDTGTMPVVIDDIERIEVLLGPGSALYGANAFVGIIHIITKTPEQTPDLQLSGSVGNLNSRHGSLIHGGTWKNLAWKLALGGDRSDRWPAQPGQEKAWYGPGPGMDMVRFNGRVDYAFNADTSLQLLGGVNQGTSDVMVIRDFGLLNQDIEESNVSLSFQKDESRMTFAYEQTDADLNPLWELAPGFSLHHKSVNIEGQYVADPIDKCKIVLGGNYKYREVSSEFLDRSHDLKDMSAFAQVGLTPLETLSLTLNCRYDDYHVIGGHWSYRGSLLYRVLPAHALRFGYGYAFRNPTYLEKYMDFSVEIASMIEDPLQKMLLSVLFPGLELQIKGGEDLDPASIETFEVGYRGSLLRNRAALELNIFYNKTRDHLAIVPTDSVSVDMLGMQMTIPTERTNVNSEGTHSYGGEVAFHIQGPDSLRFFANYAFQRCFYDGPFTPLEPGQLNPTPAKDAGKRIIETPSHKASGGLYFEPFLNASANLTAHYVSSNTFVLGQVVPKKVNGYVIVNARVAYRFYNDYLEAALVGENLLHDKHYTYLSGSEIGTRMLLTLKVEF